MFKLTMNVKIVFNIKETNGFNKCYFELTKVLMFFLFLEKILS